MRLFYALVCVFLITGCDLFDKEETIPAFVLIDRADLETNASTEGFNSHSIVDVTVFADDQFVGTFELPAQVPVIKNGPVRITAAAGIKNNGIANDRIIYPFYDFVRRDLVLTPDGRIPLSSDTSAVFRYFSSGLNFFIEDFDALGSALVPTENSTASFMQISSPAENVLSGQSLEIKLNAEENVFEAYTSWELVNLPKGNNIYLELDFKGDHPLEIGIVTLDPQEKKVFALGINAQTEWTKIYVDLTNEIASQISTNAFAVYFESRSTLADGNRTLLLDNVKFIYP